MADLTMSVADQELVVLELMHLGEDILAAGTWQAPVRRLAMKGEAVMVPNANPPRYRITEKGEARLTGEEMKLPEEMRSQSPEPMPDWIVQTVGDGPESVVVLHASLTSVSGYEALTGGRRVPVVHGRMNDAGTAWFSGDKKEIDGFLQAMLDAAWKRGLRPRDGG